MSFFGPGAGGRGAVAGAAALAGAHRPGRPAAAAHAADAMAREDSSDVVGSETDDDDDDGGDEFERALGRSLDAREAEVSQPGWEPVGEEVTDPDGGATGGGHMAM